MLDAVKRYATLILLLHVLLLVLVLLFVLGAARQVQYSAREEAQIQSQDRLKLLADQTARGIESQYSSILSDLDVILRDDSAATQAATLPATLPADSQPFGRGLLGRGGAGGGGGGGRAGAGRGRSFTPQLLTQPVSINPNTMSLLWRQLRGRVSQIFLVDLYPQANVRRGPTYVSMVLPENTDSDAQKLAVSNLDWLKAIKGSQMSSLKLPTEGSDAGYHLIAIPAAVVEQTLRTGGGGAGGGVLGGGAGGGPLGGGGQFGNPGGGQPGGRGGFGGPGGQGGPGMGGAGGPGAGNEPPLPNALEGPGSASTEAPIRYAVVVVVPVDKVREQFLDSLTGDEDEFQRHEYNAILVNNDGQVLAGKGLKAGINLLDQVDGTSRSLFEDLLKDHSRPEATVLEKPITLAGTRIPAQIMASAQLTVPSGRYWTLLVSSPLSDAEVIVNRVFRRALVWATFVSIAFAAILSSTAGFLIRARVRLERTRHQMLTRELEQARQIQLAWLPDLKSVPPGIDVSAANLPASHISGDFYNWFPLPSVMQKTGVSADHAESQDSGKIAIVIGDVTGHGMAAAFLMATTQLLVRINLTRYQDVGRCLREVNRQLCMQAGGFQGQFVTMLVMVLDPRRHTVQIASAGHPTPLLQVNGTVKPMEIEPQLVLGVNPDEDYHAQTFTLEEGTSVLLYTDGVVEAQGASGKQYGVENLSHLLARHQASQTTPPELIRAVLSDVKRFCNNRELLDDVTLVALRTVAAAAPAVSPAAASPSN